jgi:Na+-transporting methylmalonyl-CoA/oxaloacetate decarboxylase gamma subunit
MKNTLFNILKYIDLTFVNDITDYNILKIFFLLTITFLVFIKEIRSVIFKIPFLEKILPLYLLVILPFRLLDLKFAIPYTSITIFLIISLLINIVQGMGDAITKGTANFLGKVIVKTVTAPLDVIEKKNKESNKKSNK